jgi:hypothetical protein
MGIPQTSGFELVDKTAKQKTEPFSPKDTNTLYVKIAMENGPVEIVDLPIKHGDFPSFFVTFTRGYSKQNRADCTVHRFILHFIATTSGCSGSHTFGSYRVVSPVKKVA